MVCCTCIQSKRNTTLPKEGCLFWRILHSYEAHAGLYHQLTACLIVWSNFMSARLFGEDVKFLPPVEQVYPSLCLLGGVPGV